MTKKEEFIKAYEEAIKEERTSVLYLYIHMPTGETEIIINPKVDTKVEYVKKTYNDDLVHPNCSDIYITAYEFKREE